MSNQSGAIDLDGAANAVSNLGAMTAVGGFITFDNGDNSLTLTGTIQTQNNTGDLITLDVGAGALDTNDQLVRSLDTAGTGASDGAITLIADTLDLGTTASRISTTGSVLLRPTTATTDISLSTAGLKTSVALSILIRRKLLKPSRKPHRM